MDAFRSQLRSISRRPDDDPARLQRIGRSPNGQAFKLVRRAAGPCTRAACGPRAVPGQNIATENLAQSVLIFFNAIAVLPPLRDFWKSFPEHGRMLAS